MLTWVYVCLQCTALFELPEPHSPAEAKCPQCGSVDVEKLDGRSCSISPPTDAKMLTWEYACHQCEARFELPVPRGPKEEKETKCPRCGSMDLERLNVFSLSACPPGG